MTGPLGMPDKVDLKRLRKDLYAPPRDRFVQVVVPAMTFLAVDGHGDPDTSDDYRCAVEALYAVSYAAKFLSKRELGRDDVVLPLEGLWSAGDWSVFERGARDEWSWTMMVRQSQAPCRPGSGRCSGSPSPSTRPDRRGECARDVAELPAVDDLPARRSRRAQVPV